MTHLTAKHLRRLLQYNEKTGEFTWLKSQGRVKAGARAGCFSDFDGSWRIGIAGRLYKRARLAVLWKTGEWPRQEVVRRNGDPADDRWCNLREANGTVNVDADAQCLHAEILLYFGRGPFVHFPRPFLLKKPVLHIVTCDTGGNYLGAPGPFGNGEVVELDVIGSQKRIAVVASRG